MSVERAEAIEEQCRELAGISVETLADAALDRLSQAWRGAEKLLEAEMEETARLRKDLFAARQAIARLTERVRHHAEALNEVEAEVERLQDGPMARVNAGLRAEVERLRQMEAIVLGPEGVHPLQAEVERLRALIPAQSSVDELHQEVERLREGLKRVDKGISKWTYLWDDDGELLCSREYVERLQAEAERLRGLVEAAEEYLRAALAEGEE